MSGWPQKVRHYLELIRFSHTLFALPFAFLGAGMATQAEWRDGRSPRWLDWVAIVLCMAFARSAAMGFNRLADRRWDALNPRTANRHLPRGLLAVGAVGVFTLVSALLFTAATGLFWVASRNAVPLALSLPILLFVLGYSYAKRFTSLSHFWLGAALMLVPNAAWLAIRASWSPAPGLVGLAVWAWVAGFDIIYACQDAGFDREVGLRSGPARWGVARALGVARYCHAAMIAALLAVPWVAPPLGLSAVWYAGVAVTALLVFYEHWLVRPNDLARVNQAFFQVNGFISLLILAVGLWDMWW